MKYTMQNGKALLIVSGGSIDINFSKEYIKDKNMTESSLPIPDWHTVKKSA